MAITAFQAGVGMGAVGEGFAAILVAVGAQVRDCVGFGGLGVRVVTGLALNTGCAVLAGAPFVGGRFVAVAAQVGVWRNRHVLGRVIGLERTMAGFTSDAFFHETTGIFIETCRVALQATGLLAQFGPVALENR